jgi:aspartate dehydrogenase
MNIGFLGCGTIGKAMLEDVHGREQHKITFVQDPFYKSHKFDDFPVVAKQDEILLAKTDLVIESATATALMENLDKILEYSDLLVFSVTAFSNETFFKHVKNLASRYSRHIYIPHGAILGIDGIFDGRKLLTAVSIETVKNPKSLSRSDAERTIVYEGSTRNACELYPRNVNVHATIAMAGIGFDKTQSRIISDPSVNTNSHRICVDGEGFHFELFVSSFSTGGVTGKYTPYSACGSLNRILDGNQLFCFV